MTPIAHASAGRFVGQAVLRKEDPRLLTGRGRYTDDVVAPRHAARPLRAQRRRPGAVTRLDVSAAREAEGVVAVFTGADLNDKVAGSMLPVDVPGRRRLHGRRCSRSPIDDVRFVGDPIVLIIARSRYLAEDAAELIEIDYDAARRRSSTTTPPSPATRTSCTRTGPATS